MTTRRLFRDFFSKSSDSKISGQTEKPQSRENNEHDDLNGTKNTHSFVSRSRSGRLKEFSRLRLPIASNTYVVPDNMAQSAPVTTTARSGIGLAGRELSMHESIRVSRSLQSHINCTAPSGNKSSEANNAYDLMDKNEVF